MADVQPENGTTHIAHSIIENLTQQKLSGKEWDIVMLILRITYGWNKKTDWISNGLIAIHLDISKSSVSQSISRLIDRNIIKSKYDDKGKRFIGLNKDYDTWGGVSNDIGCIKSYTVNDIDNGGCIKSYRGGVSNDTTTNTTTTNTTLTKDTSEIFNHWLSFDTLPQHRKLTEGMKRAIKARLNDYSIDEIKEAIKLYATSKVDFWADFRDNGRGWTLQNFLSRQEGKHIEGREKFKSKKSGYDPDKDVVWKKE